MKFVLAYIATKKIRHNTIKRKRQSSEDIVRYNRRL